MGGGNGIWKVYRDSVRDSLRESFSNLNLSISKAYEASSPETVNEENEEKPTYERKLVDSLPILEHLGDKGKPNEGTEKNLDPSEESESLFLKSPEINNDDDVKVKKESFLPISLMNEAETETPPKVDKNKDVPLQSQKDPDTKNPLQ